MASTEYNELLIDTTMAWLKICKKNLNNRADNALEAAVEAQIKINGLVEDLSKQANATDPMTVTEQG